MCQHHTDMDKARAVLQRADALCVRLPLTAFVLCVHLPLRLFLCSYAFAVIWLVFISAMLVGLVLAWQRRVKEQRILDAQIAAEERAVQEQALHIGSSKDKAAGEEHKSS
jgi:hypothetical protein